MLLSRVTLLLLLAVPLASCSRKAPDSLGVLAARLDYGVTPRLPSPVSAAYATTEVTPRDPIIEDLVRGKKYDGALAGACAGLALGISEGIGDVTRWELREALWAAGYPYPVFDARGWKVVAGGSPSRELIAWIESIPDDEPMALVRARGRNLDAWVGMRARPELSLGPLPRLTGLGTPFTLPPLPGATWRVSDGRGHLDQGPLDQGVTILLASGGEWLIEVRRDKQELMRVPVYVAMEPPTEPLLRLSEPQPPPMDATDVEVHARALLDHIRDAYAIPKWKGSPVFDAAAKRFVENPEVGSAAVVASLGFRDAAAVVWACDDVTVENCLDQWVWDPRRRATLLSDRMDSYGIVASLDARGVHLTLLLVDAE